MNAESGYERYLQITTPTYGDDCINANQRRRWRFSYHIWISIHESKMNSGSKKIKTREIRVLRNTPFF